MIKKEFDIIRSVKDPMSDELWVVWEDWNHGTVQPTARQRMRVYTFRSLVTEFCVQLEYNRANHYDMDETAWMAVARFDHNVAPDRGHDIRQEGLHMDLFPNTQHERRVVNFPKVPLEQAPQWCKNYLTENREYYLERFEELLVTSPGQRFYVTYPE